MARVREYVEGCEVAWITEPEAELLEGQFKAEWMPPLTKV